MAKKTIWEMRNIYSISIVISFLKNEVLKITES